MRAAHSDVRVTFRLIAYSILSAIRNKIVCRMLEIFWGLHMAAACGLFSLGGDGMDNTTNTTSGSGAPVEMVPYQSQVVHVSTGDFTLVKQVDLGEMLIAVLLLCILTAQVMRWLGDWIYRR
jgi:hypothetical protein